MRHLTTHPPRHPRRCPRGQWVVHPLLLIPAPLPPRFIEGEPALAVDPQLLDPGQRVRLAGVLTQVQIPASVCLAIEAYLYPQVGGGYRKGEESGKIGIRKDAKAWK